MKPTHRLEVSVLLFLLQYYSSCYSACSSLLQYLFATVPIIATVPVCYSDLGVLFTELGILDIFLPGPPVAQLGLNGFSGHGRWLSNYFIGVSAASIVCTNGGKIAHCSTLQIVCGCRCWVSKSCSSHCIQAIFHP